VSKHAHLTKVLVQTVWVVIDDETGVATEMADAGVTVPAAEWPSFYERHCADFAAVQAAAAAESNGQTVKKRTRAPKRAP
jgi:hypothetical protein